MQYSPDGSGAGRKAIIDGSAQFAGSDAYLKDEELAASKAKCGPEGAIDIPVYISPIAIAFNVPDVMDLKLDATTAAKLFRGEIAKWNDPAIVALNPDAKLPDLKVTPVSRSDDSGTTKNFTEYLSAAAPDVWEGQGRRHLARFAEGRKRQGHVRRRQDRHRHPGCRDLRR